jgi:hypothetical protein
MEEIIMQGLTVKDVEFNGAVLRVAQVENIIWVGVKWVCDGLGLSEGQIKRERKRLQEDLVLSKGGRNLVLPTNGGNQDVLCLMLDFLPLWLAKINITPTMKRENPALTENLIEYQLKAKDVLAEAFLPKRKEEVVPAVRNNMIQIPIPEVPNYAEEFEILYAKLDDLEEQNQKLYNGMSNMAKLLLDMSSRKETQLPENKIPVKEISEEDSWKQIVYGKAENIVCNSSFRKTASVLKHIYDYMRQNYGICWEQEAKDYKERNNLSYSPKTIEVVYQNEDLRSIFIAVLTDMEYKAKEAKEKKNEIDWSDQQILPLVKKYDDHSNGFMVTYKKVYTRMEENSRIGWKNLVTRYINECGGKPTKKDLINTRKSLQKKFTKAIKELMEE